MGVHIYSILYQNSLFFNGYDIFVSICATVWIGLCAFLRHNLVHWAQDYKNVKNDVKSQRIGVDR